MILKKIYNCLMLVIASSGFIFFNSCDNDDDKSATAKLELKSFNLQDYGNEGNASDIYLTGQFLGTLDKFEKLRFMFTSSASAFDVAKALSLLDSTYAILTSRSVFVSHCSIVPQIFRDAISRN